MEIRNGVHERRAAGDRGVNRGCVCLIYNIGGQARESPKCFSRVCRDRERAEFPLKPFSHISSFQAARETKPIFETSLKNSVRVNSAKGVNEMIFRVNLKKVHELKEAVELKLENSIFNQLLNGSEKTLQFF